jgi:UDP:flavonoid glycosyltransferase YjiC (YdhE family)
VLQKNVCIHMKVMISWELGGNYGHLTRHIAFAKSMQQRGHTVLFFVRDTAIAHNVLRPHGLTYVSAPQAARWHGPTNTMRSYADILRFHGLAELSTAMPLFEAWREIFAQFQPDLLVPDHSPAALIVAKCLKIPTLEIASGFERPPDITPYPDFRPWLPSDGSEVRNEARILDVINAFGKRHTASAPSPDLPTALKAKLLLLASFPELEHYPMRQGGRYIGPITHSQDGLVADWKNNSLPKVFVYLRRFAGIEAVLNFLSGASLDTILVCPDLSVSEVDQLEGGAVQVFRQPVQLEHILKLCDLCISHGGLGMSSSCLLSATKALVIPIHIEQLLLANSLTRCGIGVALKAKEVTLNCLERVVTLLLTEASYTAASHRLAQKYSTYDVAHVVQRLVNTAERLVHPVAPKNAGPSPSPSLAGL